MGPRQGAALVCALLLGGVASAADIGVVPKKLVVVDKLAVAGKAKLVFVSKDTAAGITKGTGTDVDMISVDFALAYANGSAGVPSRCRRARARAATAGW